MPEPFPALAAAGRSLHHVRLHLRDLAVLGAPWYLVAFLVAVVAGNWGHADLAARLAALVAGGIVGAAWCRHLLTGERRRLPAPLDATAVHFVGWQLALGIVAAIPMAAPILVRMLLGSGVTEVVVGIVAALVGLWAAGRLALHLPAVATREPDASVAGSWRLSAGAQGRVVLGWIALLFSLLALTFVAVAVLGAFEALFRGPDSMPDPRFAIATGLLVQLFALPCLIGYAATARRVLQGGPLDATLPDAARAAR